MELLGTVTVTEGPLPTKKVLQLLAVQSSKCPKYIQLQSEPCLATNLVKIQIIKLPLMQFLPFTVQSNINMLKYFL
jgi:hypothetical protein